MLAKRRPYEWDWAGACDPSKNGYQPFATFSVGCFQWLPKTGVRKGLKRGKVVKRFRGPVSDPESVYQQAAAWCAKRNEEECRDNT